MTVRILVGDARERLRDLPDRSVHCVVSSPAYWGLRSYLPEGHVDKHLELGLEPTPADYVANLVDVFREVRRVLRDDGTAWLVLGDSFATGAGKVGAHPGGGAQGAGWSGHRGARGASRLHAEGAIGPMTQPNRLPQPGLKPKDLVGIPWAVAFALRTDGWWLRSDIVWCLSPNTRVYARTQKRAMPMTIRDMARLDPQTVDLWMGEKWSRVLGWSRTSATESLRVTLRSGEDVFWIDGARVGVTETARFLSSNIHPSYATQSGPMLVVGGRINPRIHDSGTSKKIRNGVGVTDGRIVRFAISNQPVTFHQFANLFRERLHCPDALFLDGSISALYAPSISRHDRFRPMGPIVSVVEKK